MTLKMWFGRFQSNNFCDRIKIWYHLNVFIQLYLQKVDTLCIRSLLDDFILRNREVTIGKFKLSHKFEIIARFLE